MRLRTLWRNINYKLKSRTGYNVRTKNRDFLRKQLLNIIICIIIVLIIVIIKSINTEPTEKAIKIVRDTINYTVDIKKDSSIAYTFVKDIVNGTKNAVSVFNDDDDSEIDSYVMPVDGKIYQSFGEERRSNDVLIFHPGIKIMTSDSSVKAIEKGLVLEVKTDKLLGKSIIVIHDELTSVYGHLDEISVYEGQTVEQGEELGKLHTGDKKRILYLELRQGNNPINPLEIINESTSGSVLR